MKKIIFIFFLIVGNCSVTFSQTDRVLVLNPLLKPFYHGVASGDPLTNKVIIWTRLTPDTGFVGSANVDWRVALDTGMTNIVQSGTHTTDINRDYTVKVDVTGLQPDTWYYYEFSFNGDNSIRGRTKTTPVGMKDSLRFAVVSCADYQEGYFNAYKVIKQRNDIDAVIHLGDYMYEGGDDPGAPGGRTHEPTHEIIDLFDYRTRLSQYHLDEDLMRLHQQYPFIMVWDDHESTNNSWKDGADNHTEGAEGTWVNRKKYSKQAYYEWLPVRPQIISGDSILYRKIAYGNLLDLIMVDTRLHGREQQAGTTGSTVNDPNRTILGTDQYTWVVQNLITSSASWKILGNQVMFAPLQVAGIAVNEDQWDGYPAERNSIMSQVLANNVEGVVVLTGDIHTAWGNDVPTANYESNGDGSAFVEYVTPSITSSNSPVGGIGEAVLQLANNHMKYINLTEHGFMILDVNQVRAQSDWFYVNTLTSPSGSYHWDESWYVNHNERHLRNTVTAAFPRAELNHLQAPQWPRVVSGTSGIESEENILIGVYPNPFITDVYVQYHLENTSMIELIVTDMNGKVILSTLPQFLVAGIHSESLQLNVSAGTYILKLRVNSKDCFMGKIIKQ